MTEPKKPKRKKSGGRQKGTPNKTTVAIKQAVMMAFDGIGGAEGLTKWARRNKALFYTRIMPRLIPHEIGVTGKVRIEEKRAVLKQIPDAVIDSILAGEAPAGSGGQVH